jgi:hypothetical protein
MDHWSIDEDDPDYVYVSYDDQIYKNRNYDLFSILADVRNGYGFAGIKTGDGFKIIDEPRGFPENCSKNVKKIYEMKDGHSYSWITLKEILNFDWTQKTEKCGYVTLEEWASFKYNNKPERWAGSIEGPSISIHSSDKFEQAWEELKKENNIHQDAHPIGYLGKWAKDKNNFKEKFISKLGSKTNPYVFIEWEVSYYESVKEFLSETVPKLLKIADGSYDSVRILFYFDC